MKTSFKLSFKLSRDKWILLGIIALFVVPFIAAKIYESYYRANPNAIISKAHGVFPDTPITIPEMERSEVGFTLVYLFPRDCLEACAEIEGLMRRVLLRLHRHQHLVSLEVHQQGSDTPWHDVIDSSCREYLSHNSHKHENGCLVLFDFQGLAVLFYENDIDPGDLLSDLKAIIKPIS